MPFDYIDVLKGDKAMTRMLEFTKGQRTVPVIVEKGEVRLGYKGGS